MCVAFFLKVEKQSVVSSTHESQKSNRKHTISKVSGCDDYVKSINQFDGGCISKCNSFISLCFNGGMVLKFIHKLITFSIWLNVYEMWTVWFTMHRITCYVNDVSICLMESNPLFSIHLYTKTKSQRVKQWTPGEYLCMEFEQRLNHCFVLMFIQLLPLDNGTTAPQKHQ